MERQEMVKGKNYSDAYEDAVTENTHQRDKMALLIQRHPPLILPDTITRDKGIIENDE
jgi:hypothetical protein